jgi:hypothetical protein
LDGRIPYEVRCSHPSQIFWKCNLSYLCISSQLPQEQDTNSINFGFRRTQTPYLSRLDQIEKKNLRRQVFSFYFSQRGKGPWSLQSAACGSSCKGPLDPRT